jgi:hypothetical protein
MMAAADAAETVNCHFDRLPVELVDYILGFLHGLDLEHALACAFLCRRALPETLLRLALTNFVRFWEVGWLVKTWLRVRDLLPAAVRTLRTLDTADGLRPPGPREPSGAMRTLRELSIGNLHAIILCEATFLGNRGLLKREYPLPGATEDGSGSLRTLIFEHGDFLAILVGLGRCGPGCEDWLDFPGHALLVDCHGRGSEFDDRLSPAHLEFLIGCLLAGRALPTWAGACFDTLRARMHCFLTELDVSALILAALCPARPDPVVLEALLEAFPKWRLDLQVLRLACGRRCCWALLPALLARPPNLQFNWGFRPGGGLSPLLGPTLRGQLDAYVAATAGQWVI